MHRLSSIILLLGLIFSLQAQSPHGADFKMNCGACHTSDSWEIPADAWDFKEPSKSRISNTTGWTIDADTSRFNHYNTDFPLLGQHVTVNCRSCHETLVFSEAQTECISCHTDMHNQTVGSDCARCHSTEHWLVDNITELHQDNGFPLLGAHAVVSCNECHISASELEFNRIGNDCVNCHLDDYNATTNPNHPEAGFSTDCSECHKADGLDWSSNEIIHDFFPLTKGHDIADCARCHTNGNYTNTPTECVACHQTDYNETQNPNHQGSNLSTNCTECHTTDVGWVPAVYEQHDADYFPIYSGAHNGEWSECIDCHTNAPNYVQFSCTTCHTNPETDDDHTGIDGYSYDSPACLACHPTGSADDDFDHNQTNFPLMGAHTTVDCIACHADGFPGTPTDCAACHIEDFNQATNPDHQASEFPLDCEDCHNETAWVPSTFDHNAVYPFTGAHISIANECVACHNGDYNNTPNTCAGCHTEDYNQSVNPNHVTLNLSTDCESCHTTEPDWMPASFDIHNDYYVLNGAHALIANDCAACHNGEYNNTPNTCFGCHAEDYNNTIDPNHTVLQFTTDCQSCHTESEWVPSTFDHDGQYFPIYSGAHEGEWSDCIDCHTNLSNYAEFSCTSCHDNPQMENDHVGINGYSYNNPACLACHPTGSANDNFDHNQTGFQLTGAHITIDCIACHANGFPGTPTDCAACHTPDFNQSTNPNHVALGLPADCESCHTTEPGWSPASFDIHDDFYALNGAHSAISNDCAACHNGDYNNTPNTCVACHTDDFNQTTNPDHQASQFPIDCESCHTESAWVPSTFDHNNFYPLTGAHDAISDDCVACHNGDYSNTPNTCSGCHIQDYEQSVNPNHTVLDLPTDCESCHTTEPDWIPASFDIHNDYYVLNGAHALIANDCAVCHNGDYNNTPNTCFGCHAEDYNNTVDPNHVSLQFSTDCQSCHTESEWVPSTFDHDVQYFPIYSGAHDGVWSECLECHTNPSNYAEFSCTTCHVNPETDDAHIGINGYSYNSSACLACHPSGSADDNFDHNQTGFPLTGAHITIDCIACHANGYQGTPTECVACHTTDYNQSTNPNHVALGLPTDCESCHTTEPDWVPATFDIHDDYYVLNGAHALIADDCATCHNGDYNNTPNTCFGCHEDVYNQTTDPNHLDAQFPTTCEDCHTEDDWVPSTFDHNNFYPLTGAHLTIENDCMVCHNGDYDNTPNTCEGCHTEDYNQSTNPNHVALGLPMDCESCHTTEPDWMPATFDIHDDYYVLNGAHALIADDCAACHNGDYNNTPNTCFGCHEDVYNQTTDPNHLDAQFPTTCEDCHTEDAWIPSTFDHNNFYPLTGAHLTIENDCVVCHNGDYDNTPNTCEGCHTEDYNQSTNPNHVALGLPMDCESCHTTEPDWMPATFDIHDDYYVLNGAHALIADDCAVCHNGDYNNTPNTCFGCHEEDYNQATNPDHVASQFPTTCEDCHTEDAWIPSTFDHNNFYPLTGAHLIIENDCFACHNGDYDNTPNTCEGCHTDDYNQSTNPNHVALGLPMDCESCHTTEPDWMPATFDIHDDYYVLNGAHAIIADDCAACHNGDYNNTPNTCFGCHEDDYNQTTNPDHVASQFPTTCEDCHTEDAWIPSTFDHNNFYPLTGAHLIIENECFTCHNGDYDNTPNTCEGCHTDDYNQSTNPNHVALGLPMDCESCHTTDPDWMPATFDIHDDYYVLNGAHAIIADDCAACHNGDYNNTPNTCFGCHEDDYNQTTNPDHVAGQLPTTCEDCHTEDAWIPSTFDHNNFYPLTGAHLIIENDCNACHNGDYDNTPNTCEGCHTDDYNQSTNPNHVNLGLPMDCESCHTTDPDWMPATFPIHNDYYVLNGAHAIIADDCAACHNGDYNNTPNTCFGCHEDDYNQATNPDHVTSQLPTTCEDCHTEDAWIPSTFDHNNFYPLTGAHLIIENECFACHNGDYDNTPNTCEGCHTDDYNQSTNPNHVALGLPMDCESCHTTDPDWMPATFDIHDDYYVLNGAHAIIADDCAACHNGDYNNTPNTCFGCHEDDYNNATDPDHLAAGFPTTCEDCHTEDTWIPSTFDHDNMYFPIYSGKHDGEWMECIECHTTQGDFSEFSCIDCHEHDDPVDLEDKHQGISGYEYSSPACYACHPDGEK